VKGKEVWRLTGSDRLDETLRPDPLRARVLSLVRRLVQGEERNDQLFAALKDVFHMVLSEADALARVLAALGYLNLEEFVDKSDREKILVVNKALKETQL
jgi:hypothetical protein